MKSDAAEQSGILEDIKYAHCIAHKALREFGYEAEFNDMKSIAVLAMCECRKKFDTELGVSFTTYAFLRIRGAVLDEIRRRRKAENVEIFGRTENSISDDTNPLDEIPSPLDGPVEIYEGKRLQQRLLTLMEILTPKEKSVIELLYFEDIGAEDAGLRLGGKSKSWVSRYHQDALLSLKLAFQNSLP